MKCGPAVLGICSILAGQLALAKEGGKAWQIQVTQEPVTRTSRVLAFNDHSTPEGSYLRLECRTDGATVAFRVPYWFNKPEIIRAVTRVDDYPIAAAAGYGGGDSDLVILKTTRITYERLLKASRVDTQISLPDGQIAAFSYALSNTSDATRPLSAACPPEKIQQTEAPIGIEPGQVPKYLNGELTIDPKSRTLVESAKP